MSAGDGGNLSPHRTRPCGRRHGGAGLWQVDAGYRLGGKRSAPMAARSVWSRWIRRARSPAARYWATGFAWGNWLEIPACLSAAWRRRGALGGLARATLDAVDLLDAAGFDLVLIETVGVGQDEVDIVRVADTTVVVSAPGLGDDIQAIKAGVLEIADLHVVSKADRPDANKTVTELKQMLMLGLADGGLWRVPVIATSAETGEGIEALLGDIDKHRAHLAGDGLLAERKRRSAEARTLKIAEELVRRHYASKRDAATESLIDQVSARELDPHSAARRLLGTLNSESTS